MAAKESGSPSTERSKRVTLQDIADVVGVKKMVVSNALNGTGRVAPSTIEKVKRVARELHYIPNFAARALTAGRTGIISILCGPMNEPYYANMVHALEQHIVNEGFNLMLMRSNENVKEMVNATGNIAVDGAIAVDMLGLVDEFRSHPAIPCVSISTYKQSFVDNVTIDLSQGVEQAIELMIGAGRRRIAYVITADVMTKDVRSRTYVRCMEKAGLEVEIINVLTNFPEEVESRLKAYIQEKGCPEGLLCQNDPTAMGAYRVFKELGISIPKDVLLVGCDGHPHMRDFDPPLSTIVQPTEEVCAAAWQFLKDRIAQPDLPHLSVSFPGKLLVTESLVPGLLE